MREASVSPSRLKQSATLMVLPSSSADSELASVGSRRATPSLPATASPCVVKVGFRARIRLEEPAEVFDLARKLASREVRPPCDLGAEHVPEILGDDFPVAPRVGDVFHARVLVVLLVGDDEGEALFVAGALEQRDVHVHVGGGTRHDAAASAELRLRGGTGFRRNLRHQFRVLRRRAARGEMPRVVHGIRLPVNDEGELRQFEDVADQVVFRPFDFGAARGELLREARGFHAHRHLHAERAPAGDGNLRGLAVEVHAALRQRRNRRRLRRVAREVAFARLQGMELRGASDRVLVHALGVGCLAFKRAAQNEMPERALDAFFDVSRVGFVRIDDGAVLLAERQVEVRKADFSKQRLAVGAPAREYGIAFLVDVVPFAVFVHDRVEVLLRRISEGLGGGEFRLRDESLAVCGDVAVSRLRDGCRASVLEQPRRAGNTRRDDFGIDVRNGLHARVLCVAQPLAHALHLEDFERREGGYGGKPRRGERAEKEEKFFEVAGLHFVRVWKFI